MLLILNWFRIVGFVWRGIQGFGYSMINGFFCQGGEFLQEIYWKG